MIFIIAAIYTYRRYVSSKINPEYVDNSEFVPEGANRPSDVADLYFFYTTWCPHCKKSMPIWQSLKSEFDNKEFKGTVVKNSSDKSTLPNISGFGSLSPPI